MFGAVLVTGARQTGKTTMLEHLTPGIVHLTLDQASVLRSAKESAELFFDYNPPPICVDEIQKAPELFPEMKRIVDADKRKGLFYLSGSQQFRMMKNVTESLAGRIGVVRLCGLSLREKYGIAFDEPFLPSAGHLAKRARRENRADVSPARLWEHIHRGGMPALAADPGMDWARYFGAYVMTYIERDVRELTQVGDTLKFQTFTAALAARTGQMLNLADVCGDVGISHPTAERWLSVLTASNLVFLLRPWFNNATKRAVKTPKIYFMDTGLAACLTKWTTPETLRQGAMSGAFFETFVVTEILKSYLNAGETDPPLYYYRDRDKREIDLLIVKDGVFYPIEIKQTASPNRQDAKAFSVLDGAAGMKRGPGGVVCLSDRLLPLTESDAVIPAGWL
jgi:predicted AAA+ superfamily ATPase